MRPTRNRPGLIASLVIALLAAAWSACTDSPSTPLRPTASPPPNPTTLTGITISYPELMLVERDSATIVIRLDSAPGEDIEVQIRAEGTDEVVFTPDRLTWSADEWQQPREVMLTAVADRVDELVETHELQIWTYRGSETGSGRHILATERVQLTLADNRGLIALTGDSAGEFILEWVPADQRTQLWQYRWRSDQERAWSAWSDVPQSGADTASVRLTGLPAGPARGFYFQVRQRPGSASRFVSEVALGVSGSWYGADDIAMVPNLVPLERGGKFRFNSSAFTFVVPEGVLLMVTQEGGGGVIIDNLWDLTTEARMSVETQTGEVLRKTFWDAATNSYQLIWVPTGDIAESWSGVPPPPGHDIAALWEQIEQSIRREPLPSQ